MKRIIISLCFLLMLFVSCDTLFPYPKDVTFKITGTNGLSFSGSYGNISTTSSVDGIIPASYNTELEDEYDVVVGVFQKDEENGTLTVELYVENDLKETASTSAAYGIVTVSYTD